jgi:dTDP-glucose 4,6-dehydratase
MERGRPGEAYHLSTNNLISVRDLVAKIADIKGKRFEDVVSDVETRPGLDMACILDDSKAKREFTWWPLVHLEDGLNEAIKWVDANWDEILEEPLGYIHKE